MQERVIPSKLVTYRRAAPPLSIQSAFDSPKPTTHTGGISATAIAVPAKLEEIFGSTLANPAIAPAAIAIPRSIRVGWDLNDTPS